MSPQQELIYNTIKTHPGWNGAQIAVFVGANPNTVRNIIAWLRALGVVKNKSKCTSYPGQYFIDKRRKI